ncbi:hypothetical protein HZS_7469 [Henneguya salminicola]|nr:hypothetical protein HZS_7469 [Henneguya salminicola]
MVSFKMGFNLSTEIKNVLYIEYQQTINETEATKVDYSSQKRVRTFELAKLGRPIDNDEFHGSLQQEVKTDVHKIDVLELLQRFHTNSVCGLSSQQALELLEKNGKNSLTPPKKPSKILIILKELFGGISLLLNIGGILCIVSYIVSDYSNIHAEKENIYLGVILIIIVLFTTIFTFIQQFKTTKLMESFNKLLPQESLVLRDSKKIMIKSDEIVVGDIIFLRGGDMVPADIRILSSKKFKIDNSSLTGETEPQKRIASQSSKNFLEAENIAFAYTYAIEGFCKGVVVSTGDGTVIGKIAELTTSLTIQPGTLSVEINEFIRIITIIAFVIGIVFFILSLTITKSGFIPSVIFLIGIIVANIPEGLVVTVTISLALTAKRMAKKNCLVKSLECVETLGNTSVICSDKTGTITQNRMTVSNLWCDNKINKIELQRDSSWGKKSNLPDAEKYISLVCCICNHAQFREGQEASLPITELLTTGDATESALIKFIQIKYNNIKEIRSKFKRLFENPFDSNTKIHECVHENLETGEYLISMKGAPERIINKCTKIMINNQILNINEQWTLEFEKSYKTLGEMGERVLGLCYRLLTKEEYLKMFPDKFTTQAMDAAACDLCFLGLISLIDPPRPGAPYAIERCKSSGIRVIMITGDHSLTAAAIAKNVGILTLNIKSFKDIKEDMCNYDYFSSQKYSAVITGDDLYNLTARELEYIISNYSEIVFARTSPRQKLVIVEALQRTGHIVSVTGDGVNDTPALRKANIGIAMGITGSDVAIQAADIILLDDNFSSIVTGIKEGRLIFDNLKKSVAYTLTSNIPEIVPFILNVLCGIPIPLGLLTILCIDMTTDLIPAISLAYEKPEMNIMSRKPRNVKKDKLVGWKLIRFAFLLIGTLQTLASMLSYLYLTMDNGFFWNELQLRSKWSHKNVLYVTDTYGQEWSYVARHELEYRCHSAYYLSIVMIQWSDLLISKTRSMSIFTHGIFNNKILIFGLFSETILSLIFVYVPFCNIFLKTRPFNPKYLIPALIFAVLLWIFDELRRYFIRNYPKSFLTRETYY